MSNFLHWDCFIPKARRDQSSSSQNDQTSQFILPAGSYKAPFSFYTANNIFDGSITSTVDSEPVSTPIHQICNTLSTFLKEPPLSLSIKQLLRPQSLSHLFLSLQSGIMIQTN